MTTLLLNPVQAQQPVKIVVGYPPGGGVDTLARILQHYLEQKLNKQVIVESKSGASGTIATNYVSQSEPDGYTLLVSPAAESVSNPYLFKDVQPLTPIAMIGIIPNVVVVNPSLPVNNAKELVAYIKANSDKITFSSPSVGNLGHLAGELLNLKLHTHMLHIPYRGAAPALVDVASGIITMTISSYTGAKGLIEAGKVKLISSTSYIKLPDFPDLQPLSTGDPALADFEVDNWIAVFGPAKMPPKEVQLLNTIVNEIISSKEVKDKFVEFGVFVKAISVKEFEALIENDRKKYSEIIKQLNLKL